MKHIILDTNFLLIPVQFGVDIFEEISRLCLTPYELFVVEQTKDELEKIIATQNEKDRKAARIALELLKAKNVKALPNKGSTVDESLVLLGKEGAIIATQDKDLKRELKSLGVPRIVLRKKRYLGWEGA